MLNNNETDLQLPVTSRSLSPLRDDDGGELHRFTSDRRIRQVFSLYDFSPIIGAYLTPIMLVYHAARFITITGSFSQ